MSLPEADPRSLRGRLVRAGEALSKQPHLGSIRDGVVGSLPLILLGSVFLLLAAPPWPGLARFLPNVDALRMGTRACAGLVSIYACAATALALAKRRAADPAASVTTALSVFMLLQHPSPLAAGGLGLPIPQLGAGGLFPAFAAAIFAVETIAFFERRKWNIQLGGGAPDAVVRSFAALLPATTCVLIVWTVVHVAGIDLANVIGAIFAPLVRGSESLPALVLVVLIDSSLYLVGVHPFSVLSAAKPIWLAQLADNMAAVASGHPAHNLATQEFFVWFVWQGGSGGTLALAIQLLFAKSKQLKLVGRAGFVPAVFNINEPLLFGVPVVLNGRLAVPFVVGPVISVLLAYAAMKGGLVNVPSAEVVWTLPAPVGAFLSTGGDVRAVVLQMTNLVITSALWWPFVRRYDRALLKAETVE